MAKFGWTARLSGTMFALMASSQLMAAPYSNVQVTGNSRIEDDVVASMSGLSAGGDYSPSDLNAAVQRLYASGLFSSVEIVPSGSTLRIQVAENATIGRVFFEGNTNFKDDQLENFITINSRDGLDRTVIEQDAQNIRRFYAANSRFDAQVNPVIIPVNDGVYNVVFEISEGEVANVDRVTFQGNQAVQDWQLRRTIETGETGLFSSIYSADDFASEKLLSDRQRIENYYQENGYYNAQIRATTADYNAVGDYYLTYTISEGRQYRFGNVTFTNEIPGVNPTSYSDLSEVVSGKVYKASDIRESIDAMEERARKQGLPFLRIEPVVTTNESDGTINVNYRFYQGEPEYVERIDIHGNDVTLDRVIRREFEIVEGDPMNGRKLTEARRRLQASGLFERVEVNARDSAVDGKKVIDVEVQESNTGSLNFGANYSGSSGLLGFIELSEDNFLGRGQRVAATIRAGQSQQNYNLSFTEPGLFERDLAAGFDLYYRDADRKEALFQTTEYGFEPKVSFPTGDNSRMSISYFLRSNEIRDVISSTSPLVIADEGTLMTSGIGLNWVYDKLDSSVKPTRGYVLRLGTQIAGLGGDSSWYQYGGKGKVYYPVYSDNVILTAELEGGSIQSLDDNAIRITDRYFLGSDSFLGFRAGGLGPRDKTDKVNSSLGGNNYAAFRTELNFPTGLPEDLGISGSIHYQAGSVWGLDRTEGGASGTIDDGFHLRQSAGVSLLWNLGGQSLRFSWTDVLEKQDYDNIDEFQISFASRF